MRGKKGCLEMGISSLPGWQPYWASSQCRMQSLTELRNWRNHKFSTLWHQCAKSKIQLFLGTFMEMKSGLLKWCHQNHIMHYRWKGNLLYCTSKQIRVSYLQLKHAVFKEISLCWKQLAAYDLLMTKQAWLPQMPFWESKHDFSSKSQINYFKRKWKFK